MSVKKGDDTTDAFFGRERKAFGLARSGGEARGMGVGCEQQQHLQQAEQAIRGGLRRHLRDQQLRFFSNRLRESHGVGGFVQEGQDRTEFDVRLNNAFDEGFGEP